MPLDFAALLAVIGILLMALFILAVGEFIGSIKR